jgi:hypothetical protein
MDWKQLKSYSASKNKIEINSELAAARREDLRTKN